MHRDLGKAKIRLNPFFSSSLNKGWRDSHLWVFFVFVRELAPRFKAVPEVIELLHFGVLCRGIPKVWNLQAFRPARLAMESGAENDKEVLLFAALW
jgi:hypothetical protein